MIERLALFDILEASLGFDFIVHGLEFSIIFLCFQAYIYNFRMERIQSINPKRLAWCLEDSGISLAQFSAEVGISLSSIQKALDGEGGLTFGQLRKVGNFFGRGVLFFLDPTPLDSTQVRTPQFRTLANQKPELSARLKALIERAERQRDIYLSLLDDLDEVERQKFDPPNVSGRSLKEAAATVRMWLNLSRRNTFDSYRAAIERRGILVFRSNGYNGKWQIAKENPILGFSLFDDICPLIVVKKLDWEPRQSFTLLHELGHLILQRSSSIDDESDLQSHSGHERDANAFAGYVLVPDAMLAEINDGDRPSSIDMYDEWLREFRNEWGVSTEVILRRLSDSNRLSRQLYTQYRQWRENNSTVSEDGGNRAYRHREPKHVFGDTFVRTVFDALSANQITINKASNYLDNLKVKDIRLLEKQYAGV